MPNILLLDGARRRLPKAASWLSAGDVDLRDARTPEEALDAIAASRPDLVVADLERTPRAALDAFRTIRSAPAAQDVPFLVLVAPDRAHEVHEVGRVHVLAGAAAPDVVLAEVRRLVEVLGRVAPRIPVDAPVAFWRDGNPAEGRLIDISSSGFFTATSEPQPVGARLEVSFALPRELSSKVDGSSKLVTGEVIVVRRAPGARSGFGARFFQLPKKARRLIDGYLASRGPRTP